MATHTTMTMQRFMRQRLNNRCSVYSYAIAAPNFGLRPLSVRMSIAPIGGLAHGCIVSISRGSPPPKKR